MKKPCFPSGASHKLASFPVLPYDTLKLFIQQGGHRSCDPVTALATSLYSSCTVWNCDLGHCPVVGGNVLQWSDIQRLSRSPEKWNDRLPGLGFILSCTNPQLYHHQTLKCPCHAWGMVLRTKYLHVFLLSNALHFDWKSPNLDTSVHTVTHFTFSLQLWLEGQ